LFRAGGSHLAYCCQSAITAQKVILDVATAGVRYGNVMDRAQCTSLVI
jgi:hypothetical protein